MNEFTLEEFVNIMASNSDYPSNEELNKVFKK